MGEKTSSLRVKRLSDLIHGASIGQPISRSAHVTAVFEMDDGREKRFTRMVQGSSSDHKINGEVSVCGRLFVCVRVFGKLFCVCVCVFGGLCVGRLFCVCVLGLTSLPLTSLMHLFLIISSSSYLFHIFSSSLSHLFLLLFFFSSHLLLFSSSPLLIFSPHPFLLTAFIFLQVVSSQTYLKQLESLGINVKGKNFLVFQGAVESIAMKNPRERTALFEEISG